MSVPRLATNAWLWGYVSVVAAIAIAYSTTDHTRDIRFYLDLYDLRTYFRSSAWVVGGGTLYKTVPSEYPLLANLIFGAIRLLSYPFSLISSDFAAFVTTWVICSLLVLARLWRSMTRHASAPAAVWAIASPATVFFSLYRYDIYPAAACWAALLAARDRRWTRSALLFGVCVGLKGYAIFCLPALLVFYLLNIGLRRAIGLGVIALLPFVASELYVLLVTDLESLVHPFRFHLTRSINGESTYDALLYVLDWVGIRTDRLRAPEHAGVFHHASTVLSLAGAGTAALMKPRTADRLTASFLVAVLGFMASSCFYSPQWILWILPMIALSGNAATTKLGVAFGWLTYLYFPVSYDVKIPFPLLWQASVVATAAVRIALLATCFRGVAEAPQVIPDVDGAGTVGVEPT